MAVTRKQRERAAQDLAEKIRLENQFIPKLSNLFNRIADEYDQSMRDLGVPSNLDNWNSFFEELLLSHYQATGDVFAYRLREQLNIELTPEEDEKINQALMIFFAGVAVGTASVITETNKRQSDDAITAMQAQEAEEIAQTGKGYSMATRATVATSVFSTMMSRRVSTIAISETQLASEAAKFTEAEVINGGEPSINSPIPPTTRTKGTKTWISQRDERVRPTHIEADGQEVGTDEFFIVGGFNMMYPRDRSAPIEEWINCRCNAIYDPDDNIFDRIR